MQVVLGGGADPEKDRDVDLAMAGGHEPRSGAHLQLQFARDGFMLAAFQQVGLVEDHHVRAVQLVLEEFLDGILVVEVGIGRALGLHGGLIVGEAALGQRLGIDHGDDAIDSDARLDLGPVEGAHQRLGQCEPRGLDHDVLRRVGAVEELPHGRHEIVGHGAADAAVGKFDHVLVAAGFHAAAAQDLAIDADIAELVDDERDAAALGVLQHVADQRGLARTEEAGDDGGRDLCSAHVA